MRICTTVSLLALLLTVPGIGGEAHELRVMSFNLRYGTASDGENAWSLRRGLVEELLRDFRPDVLGVQEALHFQLEEISESLTDLEWIGVGRDDGLTAGEYSAIFFRGARLELLEEGTFWFSDEPEVPGSMTWGNELPRICTWGRFRDRADGRTFTVFNLHWDHRSQRSREEAAMFLLRRIREQRAGTPGEDEGVVVTGDFNAGEDNPAFRALLDAEDPVLLDAFRLLHPGAREVGTYHGFRGGSEGEKIDAILVGPGWVVMEAEIMRAGSGGRFPSDHYPVTAVLGWKDR
jgi:endonuclease/exonuclease/phosphatase family metal-dependent hydrolase